MSAPEENIFQGADLSASDGLDRKTLFIRSVPFDATSEQLSEFFSQFAPVKHAVIVTDADKQSRGFGFVSFAMEEDTVLALAEAKKTKFQGRLLRVDIAKRRDRKDDRKGNSGANEGSTFAVKERTPIEKRRARLIIRNLPWSCKNPEQLKKIFSKYGAVFDAYIPRKKGGQMCGFAFVVMKKLAAAQKAIKESVGLQIDGREVAVDFAVEKSKWDDQKEEEEGEEEEEEEDQEQEMKEATAEENNADEGKDNDDSDSDSEDDNEDDEEDGFGELNDHDAELEEEKEEEVKPTKPKANRQEAYSVFVRNIPYDADAESLKEHFEKFGPVKYALPVIDKQTGLAKGTAFVAFYNKDAFEDCLDNAPTQASGSMLISDDVSPAYVYRGRVLFVTSTVDRKSAEYLTTKNSEKRKELVGGSKIAKGLDKRNLYLLNEGRITEQSKLAQFVSTKDMEIRDKSYKLRVQQLNKNPSLHLSMTRLAIRNLPRAMNAKALKALGRKAVVQFATEVKEEKRHPLSKEEISRSTAYKRFLEGPDAENASEDPNKKKKTKHTGVVRQSKIVMEVKGSGEQGRSRGYGFIEFRDHKAALMGLRWLNAHEVTIPEILEGLTEEERKLAELEGLNKKRLIVEFAVENAQVVKRRKERVMVARNKTGSKDGEEEGENYGKDGKDVSGSKKRKRDKENDKYSDRKDAKRARKNSGKKGNMNKGNATKEDQGKSGLSANVKHIIGKKRRQRKTK